MNENEINKLVRELRELSELYDASFTAPTQSRRVCKEAAEAIEALLDSVDMFWTALDPERLYENPGDYFNEENVFCEPVEFQRASQRTNAWCVAIPTKYAEDDDVVEDFTLHWFDSESKAISFCETHMSGEGLPLIEAGK